MLKKTWFFPRTHRQKELQENRQPDESLDSMDSHSPTRTLPLSSGKNRDKYIVYLNHEGKVVKEYPDGTVEIIETKKG